jgi:hypothetical protein
MSHPPLHVKAALEIERIRAGLHAEFGEVSGDVIDRAVRAEFARRSSSPVQDFVPIFVERSLRRRLRELGSAGRRVLLVPVERGGVGERAPARDGVGDGPTEDALHRHLELLPGQGARDGGHRQDHVRHMAG